MPGLLGRPLQFGPGKGQAGWCHLALGRWRAVPGVLCKGLRAGASVSQSMDTEDFASHL